MWFTRHIQNEELFFDFLKNENLNHRKIFIMKTTKIIIASIAASIASIASFAASSNQTFESRMQPQDVAVLMFGGHDLDNDGALDSVELANSIESLYEMRQEAIRDRRDTLVSNGVITAAEGANGIITLSLLPEDAAAIVMKDGDINQDQVLQASELIATAKSLRKLDLGTRAPRARRS